MARKDLSRCHERSKNRRVKSWLERHQPINGKEVERDGIDHQADAAEAIQAVCPRRTTATILHTQTTTSTARHSQAMPQRIPPPAPTRTADSYRLAGIGSAHWFRSRTVEPTDKDVRRRRQSARMRVPTTAAYPLRPRGCAELRIPRPPRDVIDHQQCHRPHCDTEVEPVGGQVGAKELARIENPADDERHQGHDPEPQRDPTPATKWQGQGQFSFRSWPLPSGDRRQSRLLPFLLHVLG